MSTITRQLRINGYVFDESEPTTATIQVKGVEVFNGTIPVPPVDPSGLPSELVIVEYQGSDIELENFPVSVTVNSGILGIGIVEVNTAQSPPLNWSTIFKQVNGVYVNDGRTNITIDGTPVDWEEISGQPLPANWTGWVFKVTAPQIIAFDYYAAAYSTPPHMAV